ncbi:MAG TPA: hypothetical protein VMH04_04470 [Candidatus Solibacter sp.]|nr:hypothetical protein [Candidatus Solibacter sp.]
MARFGAHLLSATILLVVLWVAACGTGTRQLQSITISSGGNINMQYTATGNFNKDPRTVSPLPVSWYVVSSNVSPSVVEPIYNYVLTTEPYSLNPCSLTDTVIALAPTDPNAPSSGAIPGNVYQDLVVTQSVSKEGGFVAAASPANCSM